MVNTVAEAISIPSREGMELLLNIAFITKIGR